MSTAVNATELIPQAAWCIQTQSRRSPAAKDHDVLLRRARGDLLGEFLGARFLKAFLDTHVAVALEEGEKGVFGPKAIDILERAALFVSPVVRLELTYLAEIGRLTVASWWPRRFSTEPRS